ncbi:MAG TPA: hypothetical protein VEY96_01195, partial [Actinomycetes bacterium]|nr:hypothetical protein [Actinomycetes bacterium]
HRSNPQPEVQVMTRGTTEEDLESGERSVQDNLALMRRYLDLHFTKDLDSMLKLIDDDIEWLVVPTGDVIRGKASLAENHVPRFGSREAA